MTVIRKREVVVEKLPILDMSNSVRVQLLCAIVLLGCYTAIEFLLVINVRFLKSQESDLLGHLLLSSLKTCSYSEANKRLTL